MSLHEVFQFATGLSERLSLGGLVPLLFLAAVLIISVVIAALILLEKHSNLIMPGTVQAYLTFFYGSFLKPHTGDKNGDQQEALESFYKTQAGAYDITRTRLLRGREEMIRLTAAQLKQKEFARKPVWVDVSPVYVPKASTPA
jgi:betaine lipid synthase